MKTYSVPAVLLLLASIATASAFDADEFWREPTNLAFDVAVLGQEQDSNICWQAMVYTSEFYKDQPMRIFAWYAWPKAEGRHPAVISIHGAGGGADLPRAQAFARAGYCCLSYDWNAWREGGQKWKPGTPLPAASNTVYCGLWYDEWTQQMCYPGPDGDWKWCTLYRSLMAARRGLTWMSLRPEVDPERLAAEGHSWGGFQAQTLAGIEPRLKAVAASASAGAWASRYRAGLEGHTRGLKPEQAAAFFERYDPASFANRIRAPLLIRLATADFFASVDTLPDYWDRIAGPKSLELLPAGNHTFWDVETRVAWFDHWLRGGPAFPAVDHVELARERAQGWCVEAAATGPAPIEKAMVCWTTSTNAAWNRRGWAYRPLTRAPDNRWRGAFAPVATGGPLRCFVSVRDANGRVASSLPVVRDLPAAGVVPPPVQHTNFVIAAARKSPLAAPTEWRRARPVEPLAAGPELVGLRSARLETLWDAQALYVRVRILEPTPWTEPPPGGEGDAVSLRISPWPDDTAGGVTAPVFRVTWSPSTNGTLRTQAFRGLNGSAPVADPGRIASSVDIEPGQSATLTVGIPWTVMYDQAVAIPGQALDFRATLAFGDYLTGERIGTIELNRHNPGDPHSPPKSRVMLEAER